MPRFFSLSSINERKGRNLLCSMQEVEKIYVGIVNQFHVTPHAISLTTTFSFPFHFYSHISCNVQIFWILSRWCHKACISWSESEKYNRTTAYIFALLHAHSAQLKTPTDNFLQFFFIFVTKISRDSHFHQNDVLESLIKFLIILKFK